jgi:hypothetical protein
VIAKYTIGDADREIHNRCEEKSGLTKASWFITGMQAQFESVTAMSCSKKTI